MFTYLCVNLVLDPCSTPEDIKLGLNESFSVPSRTVYAGPLPSGAKGRLVGSPVGRGGPVRPFPSSRRVTVCGVLSRINFLVPSLCY